MCWTFSWWSREEEKCYQYNQWYNQCDDNHLHLRQAPNRKGYREKVSNSITDNSIGEITNGIERNLQRKSYNHNNYIMYFELLHYKLHRELQRQGYLAAVSPIIQDRNQFIPLLSIYSQNSPYFVPINLLLNWAVVWFKQNQFKQPHLIILVSSNEGN